jgi:putative ABC transport system substrate-binding protein
MQRRAFIALLGGATAVWPLAAWAQQAEQIRRVGLFTTGRSSPITALGYQSFLDELRKRGFVEGRNLMLDVRSSEQDLRGFIADSAEMVRASVEVLVPGGPEVALQAAIAASPTIPIVMVAINYDPIARGYIKSLAQPGGNVTGVFLRQNELAEKQVELLKQTFPSLHRIGILWDRFSIDQFAAADSRAKNLGLDVRGLQLENPPYDFDTAFQTLTADGAQMLQVLSSPFFAAQGRHIVELSVQRRLPSMFVFRGYVQEGGLMSYGADIVEMYRQAAAHVAKILRGAKPSELPVEQPNKFELVVNLATAKAIGIEMPTAVLLRADEVIE